MLFTSKSVAERSTKITTRNFFYGVGKRCHAKTSVQFAALQLSNRSGAYEDKEMVEALELVSLFLCRRR